MGKNFEEKPTEWANWGDGQIQDAGGDIYYALVGAVVQNQKAEKVWVWHWHMPTEGTHRWQIAACSLHTVEQVEPLTLSPSLACEDGCPSHGYLENGQWRAV